jgi:hypothetical protein
MTEAGRVFGKLEEEFPNRGRVWWMLNKEINPGQVAPGAIYTGQLEHAQKYAVEKGRASKDAYQADRRSVTPGARRYVQVLDVPDADLDLGRLMREDGIPMKRPPLQTVLFRGTNAIVGPFRASYDWVSGLVRFDVLHAGQPRVFRAPRDVFKPGQLKEFSFTSNQWNPSAPREAISLVLLHRDHLDRLEKEGKAEDALSDAQVVKWGLEQLGFTRSERSEIERVLIKLGAVVKSSEGVELQARMERFRRLCESRASVAELPLEIAQLLADKQDSFRQLVERRAGELAEGRIQAILAARKQEVEAALSEQEQRLTLLKSQVRETQESLEATRAGHEEIFKRDHETRVRELEAQQRAVEERLARVAELYQSGSRELADHVLAELPLLRALGIGGRTGTPGEAETAPEHEGFTFPPFLAAPKQRTGMSEAEFLAQFADVVARHEYLFERDDLANFHISLKTGVWSVLAGPSGIGKSSLPRLYAEALGQSDEFLIVPVQPDWLDAHAVIGAFNGLSQRFEPAVGGLTDRLIAAAEDSARSRGGIYIVCLDEMNLSRVEHYFAWFLSAMELPAADRKLSLFASGQQRAGDPYAPHRVVPIGDNLRFVGTVNIDETTHFMSPKVLDRTPVITLEPVSPAAGAFSGRSEGRLGGIREVHLQDFRSWVRPAARSGPGAELLLQLDRKMAASRAGLGFRVLNRVLAYLGSAQGILSEDRALDMAVAQMVIPRLRASSPGFLQLVENLQALLPEARFPRTAGLLAKLAEADGERDFFQLL